MTIQTLDKIAIDRKRQEIRDRLRIHLGADIKENSDMLNPAFSKWYNSLTDQGTGRLNVNANYRGDNDLLMPELEAHILKHIKPISSDNLVVLVHPFYLHNYQRDYIVCPEDAKEVDQYTDKLFEILHFLPHRRIDCIALEGSVSYASTTGCLLEKGLIQDVLLTEGGGGFLGSVRARERMKIYSQRNLFLVGGYNGSCLSNSILEATRAHPKNNPKIWAIRDLVLNCPRNYFGEFRFYHPTNPSVIYDIDSSNIITLQQFFDKSDLEFTKVKALEEAAK